MAKNSIDKLTQLTPRQKSLLFAVIKEYCEFGQSVGSKEIREKYDFNFSSATIRNEFARLRDLGYLFQPFTNSPSRPTEKALKLFINQLIAGLGVTNRQQQELKKQVLELEEKQANIQKEITRFLALQTKGVGFSVNSQQENISGIRNLLDVPSEGKVSDILDFLDNLDDYKHLLLEGPVEDDLTSNLENNLLKIKQKDQSLKATFGVDNPIVPLGRGYAMVATEVILDNEKTVIGLITPTHLLADKKRLELIDAIGKVFNNE